MTRLASSWIARAAVAKLRDGTYWLRLHARSLVELSFKEVVEQGTEGHDRRQLPDLIPAWRHRSSNDVRRQRELERQGQPLAKSKSHGLVVTRYTGETWEREPSGPDGGLTNRKRDDQTGHQ